MRAVHRHSDGMFEDAVPGFSDEAERLAQSLADAFEHWSRTETYQRSSLESEFYELVELWRHDTVDESSPRRIAMHEAYQRIIGMGPAVLPYILRDLERTQDQWFWALRAITGVDPVPPEDRGYIHKMVRSWLRWGRRNAVI